MITLVAGLSRAKVLPHMGAGLAGLWLGERPILRAWSGKAEAGPFALAMNLLAPFSNRISGGFTYAGNYLEMAPNLQGEAFALHGDAFQRAWNVIQQDAGSATLALTDGQFGPLYYGATVTYRLMPNALHTRLSIVSLAAMPLPFGLGFHPWFPRSGATRLQFQAERYWPETSQHLPATRTAVAIPQKLNFDKPKALPSDWINAGFDGWNGNAVIAQSAEAVSVNVHSNMKTAILFSPSARAEFFCFEPVSHPVDAHNLPDMPGLTVLQPNQSLTATLTLEWS